jgi:glyoxylase-like metal-dependent hydrolase (beta-lactamase superfamily II)
LRHAQGFILYSDMTARRDDLELAEVGPDIWALRLPIPWEDGYVNSFLLPDGKAVDVVDCGMKAEDSLALIKAAVARLGGPGGHVRRLVVTHIHPDHYGGAGELTRRSGAELYLHRLEVPMVHPRYMEIDQLVEEVGRYLLVHGVPEQEASFMKNASRGLRDFVTPAEPALQLEGTELLQLGKRRLRVEWTPGHSPGHVCLYDVDAGFLFSGDQLLPESSPNIGLHPQSTPNPLDDYLRGLARIVELAPALVLPAHGRPFADAAGRAEQMVDHHRRRKFGMLELLSDREMNGWQVATAVWGIRSNVIDMRMALQEGLAHLQSLSVEGRVEKRASPASVTWRRSS